MSLCLWVQEGDGSKPVTDQWLPPFVIVGDNGKPVGTIEVSPQSSACANEVSANLHIQPSSCQLCYQAVPCTGNLTACTFSCTWNSPCRGV